MDTDHPHRIAELQFVPGALEALKVAAELPAHVIVVSNQSGIEKGLYDTGQMSEFNRELRVRVEYAGGRIDAFYFCPHVAAKDLRPGAQACSCSKPSPGMILDAANDFGLKDLESSFMVGDKTSDIVAGKRSRCTTILVRTGKKGREGGALTVRPDHVAEDITEAVAIIAESHTTEAPE